RRTAGAVGDRNEVRRQRAQTLDRLPEILLHLLGLGREELERHTDRHHATSRTSLATWTRVSRPSQSETAILPSEPGSGGRLRCSVASRPAAAIHCVTVSGAKPKRRWACSSRRN